MTSEERLLKLLIAATRDGRMEWIDVGLRAIGHFPPRPSTELEVELHWGHSLQLVTSRDHVADLLVSLGSSTHLMELSGELGEAILNADPSPEMARRYRVAECVNVLENAEVEVE